MKAKISQTRERVALRDISESIYSKHAPFKIDAVVREFVQNGPVQLHWKNREDNAVCFMRRVLEVATLEARRESSKNTRADISDWEAAEKLATAAHKALLKLTKHLVAANPPWPKPGIAENSKTPIRANLETPIRHMIARALMRQNLPVNGQEANAKAKLDAQLFVDTSGLLNWMATECRVNRDAIARSFQNPGRPEKRIFAQCIMEGWIYLTGWLPNETSEDFMILLEVSWSDVCGVEDDWANSVRKAKSQFSAYQVKKIASSGPSWA